LFQKRVAFSLVAAQADSSARFNAFVFVLSIFCSGTLPSGVVPPSVIIRSAGARDQTYGNKLVRKK
jgi:hypothetical protein